MGRYGETVAMPVVGAMKVDQPVAGVGRTLDELDKAIGGLEENAQRVSGRFSAVVRATPTLPGSSGQAQPREAMCEVAERLANFSHRVQSVALRMNELVDACDL